MKDVALPCIVCRKELENICELEDNQPHAGAAFKSWGHYGSTFFDPMDGSSIEINVCDDCLLKAMHDFIILEYGLRERKANPLDSGEEAKK